MELPWGIEAVVIVIFRTLPGASPRLTPAGAASSRYTSLPAMRPGRIAADSALRPAERQARNGIRREIVHQPEGFVYETGVNASSMQFRAKLAHIKL